MQFFVESDFGYSPVVRMKQPATGVRRRVLKQFAPPPDDNPELHEARPTVKLFYLGAMDTGQKVDKVVKARRGKFDNHENWFSLIWLQDSDLRSRILAQSSVKCMFKKPTLVCQMLIASLDERFSQLVIITPPKEQQKLQLLEIHLTTIRMMHLL
jgi:hypothetical protein